MINHEFTMTFELTDDVAPQPWPAFWDAIREAEAIDVYHPDLERASPQQGKDE